jgi:hypothetical protein
VCQIISKDVGQKIRKTTVEYALRDIAKPIGVSTYRVTRESPAPLQQDLPSIEDLQEVIEKLRSELEAAREGEHEQNEVERC